VEGNENPFGDLLQDYVLECLPLAEQVADTFVELERRWRADDPADAVLASLAGRLHTIKGNSAMMGLAPMREVAHALEDACELLRRRPRPAQRRGGVAAESPVADCSRTWCATRLPSSTRPRPTRYVERGAPVAGLRRRPGRRHPARAAPDGPPRRR